MAAKCAAAGLKEPEESLSMALRAPTLLKSIDGHHAAGGIPLNGRLLSRRLADVVNRVNPRSADVCAGVHALAVESDVKAARPDAEAGAM